MRTLWRRIVRGVTALVRRRAADREIDDEIAAYLDAAIADKRAAGLSAEEAARLARAALGSPTAVRDNVRDVAWESGLANLWREVRMGARGLRKSPGFAAAAVVTIALAVGPNAAIVSGVNYLLKPLAVPNATRMTTLGTEQHAGPRVFQRLAYPDYVDYRETARPLVHLAAWDLDQVALTADGTTDRLLVGIVSGDYFSTLGLTPQVGRLIGKGDDAPGGPVVVVLAHDYWHRRFGSDPSVLGSTVRINGRLATVVGVAPAGFDGPLKFLRLDAYLPLQVMTNPSRLASRDALSVRVLGRLDPGVTLARVQAALDGTAAELERAYPVTNQGRLVRAYRYELAGFEPQMATAIPTLSVLLMLLVGAVLAIACANVLGLFLARALDRRREMAVRAALGASRWQIVRLWVIEASLVAGTGGVVGGVAGLALARAVSAGVDRTSYHLNLTPDWRVFAYLAVVLLVTALAVGLPPAMRASRADTPGRLSNGRTTSTRRRQRLRTALVGAQMATSVTLLIVCGLFIRSVSYLERADLGFAADRVTLATPAPQDVGTTRSERRSSSRPPTPSWRSGRRSRPWLKASSSRSGATDRPRTWRPIVMRRRQCHRRPCGPRLGDGDLLRGHGYAAGRGPNVRVDGPLWHAGRRRDQSGDGRAAVAGHKRCRSSVSRVGRSARAHRGRRDRPQRAIPARGTGRGGPTPIFLSLEQVPLTGRTLFVRARPGTSGDLGREIRQRCAAQSRRPRLGVVPLADEIAGGRTARRCRALAIITGLLGTLALAMALVGRTAPSRSRFASADESSPSVWHSEPAVARCNASCCGRALAW